jgi:hypothetical protein
VTDFCVQQGQGCAKAHGAIGCWCGWGVKPGPVAKPKQEKPTPPDDAPDGAKGGDQWSPRKWGL